MAGWGLLPWGLGPWGSLVDLYSLGAEAVATRTIRVRLSVTPMASSPIGSGDALNPATWSVSRLDTGAAYTVLGAELHSDDEIDVLLLQPLAGFLIEHRIVFPTLRGAGGALIKSPSSADFKGLAWEQARKYGEFDRDVANPPVTGANVSGIGGTLLVIGGDYSSEQGESLARKIALRDLLTPTGAYAHLPIYGFGLGERVKVGIRPGELPGLASDISRVLRSRPWVKDASAQLAFGDDGILYVAFQMQLKKLPAPVRANLRVNGNGAVIL